MSDDSDSSEEDGTMTGEIFQRLNQNWELRRRIIANSNQEIDSGGDREAEPTNERPAPEGAPSEGETTVREIIDLVSNPRYGVRRRKRKPDDSDSDMSDDDSSTSDSLTSDSSIDSDDERDFLRKLLPDLSPISESPKEGQPGWNPLLFDPDDKSDDPENPETDPDSRTRPDPSEPKPKKQNRRLFQKRSNLTRLVRSRQIDHRANLKHNYFAEAAERLKMEQVLSGHDGCVNAIGWSDSGTRLLSGSDDQMICIHEPFSKRIGPAEKLPTDHLSNIFQTKFLPYANDRKIISSARDGLVSMTLLDESGTQVRHSDQRYGKAIIKHRKSCHKVCFIPNTQIVLSCGEDGAVYRYDDREPTDDSAKPIIQYKCINHQVFGTQFHTIDFSPNGYNFAIGGHFHAATVFDYRKMTTEPMTEPVLEIYPESLEKIKKKAQCPNITALRYNNSGSQLLCSYNDEEIHLFDSAGHEIRSFGGHRNSQTVKGVNFYGNNAEYVISGSDCGYLFIWKTGNGQLVNYQFADGHRDIEPGVLNALEPHPYLPYLATSGLDSTVKLWSPTGDNFLNGPREKIDEARKGALRNRRNRLSFKESHCDISQLSAVVRLLSHRFPDRNEDDSDDDEEPTDCRPS